MATPGGTASHRPHGPTPITCQPTRSITTELLRAASMAPRLWTLPFPTAKYTGPGNLVLRHLPCKGMQFLILVSGNSLLEPIEVNRFLSKHELSTKDDGEPIF